MNRNLLLVLALMAAGAVACSLTLTVPTVDTGPVQVLSIDEPAPPQETVTGVEINVGPGTLELSGGATGLAAGSIRFNVEEWRPTVTRTETALTIEQGEPDASLPIGEDVVNEWSLRLGNVPMELSVHAGAYSGSIDLSGVPLRSFSVTDGASDTEVEFNSPNPEQMESLTYQTGASTVSLSGLANANFSEMTFIGGAGTYTLDFSGDLRRDATVSLQAGVSSVRIEVPEGTAAVVVVRGALNSVNTIGSWSHDGDTYRHAGLGPTLRISVDMGVGSLTLVSS